MTLAWLMAAVVGLTLLTAMVLVLSPVVIEARCRVDDRIAVRSAIEARAGHGLLVVRREQGGRLEVRPFGVLLWRPRRRRRTGRWLRAALRDKESRARWRRRSRWARSVVSAAVPRWRAILGLLRDAVSAARVRLLIEGTIGFDDPADTFVFFEILRLVAPRSPRCEIEVARDYFDERLELEVTISARARPVTLMILGLRAALTRELRPVLRAAWARPAA